MSAYDDLVQKCAQRLCHGPKPAPGDIKDALLVISSVREEIEKIHAFTSITTNVKFTLLDKNEILSLLTPSSEPSVASPSEAPLESA